MDFDDALERVVAGLKTHRTVSEEEKRMIAYHEAGHALLAHIVGRGMTIHKVTIVGRGAALGYNMYLPTDERCWPRATTSSRASSCCWRARGRGSGAGRGIQRRR